MQILIGAKPEVVTKCYFFLYMFFYVRKKVEVPWYEGYWRLFKSVKYVFGLCETVEAHTWFKEVNEI